MWQARVYNIAHYTASASAFSRCLTRPNVSVHVGLKSTLSASRVFLRAGTVTATASHGLLSCVLGVGKARHAGGTRTAGAWMCERERAGVRELH